MIHLMASINDAIHRFDSSIRFDSLLRQHPINSTTRPCGMREAVKSAARNVVEGIAACQICRQAGPNHNCRSLICLTYGQFLVVLVSIGLSKSKLRREVGKIQNLRHLWHIITPLIFPPRGPRSPPDRPSERTIALLKSIKILIIF